VLGVGPIIPDALTASLSPSSSHTAGAAAAHLAALKKQKYSALSATHIVTSKAVETLRLWNEEGLSFFSGLGRHTFLMTLDPRETLGAILVFVRRLLSLNYQLLQSDR
jgi:dihydroorotase-like cyclic amidohydrolase